MARNLVLPVLLLGALLLVLLQAAAALSHINQALKSTARSPLGHRLSSRLLPLRAADRSPTDLAYEANQLSLFNAALSQLRSSAQIATPASPSSHAPIAPAIDDKIEEVIKPSTFTPPSADPQVGSHFKLKDAPVYFFGDGVRHSSLASKDPKALKSLLGGKGAALADMGHLGLSVPPGFRYVLADVVLSSCSRLGCIPSFLSLPSPLPPPPSPQHHYRGL